MKGKLEYLTRPKLREAKGVFRRLLCYQTRDVPTLLCMFVWLDPVPLQEGNLGKKTRYYYVSTKVCGVSKEFVCSNVHRCVSEHNVVLQVLGDLLLKLSIHEHTKSGSEPQHWDIFLFEALPSKFPRWTWHCLFLGQTSWWHSRYAIDFTFTSSSSISCSWTFHSQHGLGGIISKVSFHNKHESHLTMGNKGHFFNVLTKSSWTASGFRWISLVCFPLCLFV